MIDEARTYTRSEVEALIAPNTLDLAVWRPLLMGLAIRGNVITGRDLAKIIRQVNETRDRNAAANEAMSEHMVEAGRRRWDPRRADEERDAGWEVSPQHHVEVAETLAAQQAARREGIVNLTPHEVVVVDRKGATIATFPPSGEVARVRMERAPVYPDLGGIPLAVEFPGPVEGVPAPSAGRYYIVSTLVRLAMAGRADLLSPGALVRDGAGRVVGCGGFTVNEVAAGEE